MPPLRAALARDRRRAEDQAAYDAWVRHRHERLQREPEAVREEVLSEARDRLARRGTIEWSARDTEICRMRVACRIRIARYGAPPPAPEWKRQIDEVRATLGLEPLALKPRAPP
jgi:hypothetical protein